MDIYYRPPKYVSSDDRERLGLQRRDLTGSMLEKVVREKSKRWRDDIRQGKIAPLSISNPTQSSFSFG